MDDQVWGELPDDLPDDISDDISDDLPGSGDAADTAHLDGDDALGDQADSGPEPAASHGGLGSLDEPLGTESATDDFDAAVAETTELDGPDTTDGPVDHVGPAAAPSGSEALFGSDPDALPPAAGDGDDGHDFPPDLTDLAGVPEPVDGPPWSDPTVLGADETAGAPPAGGPALTFDAAPEPAELAAYDGSETPSGGDVWDALLNSDDPATSALAHWWAPGR